MCGLKRHLLRIHKRFDGYLSTIVVQWQLQFALFRRRFRACLGASAVSLFSFGVAAAIVLFPQIRALVDNFQPIEAVLSQVGATYGTILALVLTLSLIPIQRAAEVWSPSIVRLYRRDPATYATFVSLGICCAMSFLLAVRGLLALPVSIVIAFSLVVLGINLDILRWYHGHVCRLLDPVHAVKLALKEARQTIDHTKTLVTKISLLQRQRLSAEKQQTVKLEAIESINFPRVPGYPDLINFWVNDLAEIAVKAVSRGEKLLARTAVFAISDLALYYLSSRRLNLTIKASPEAMFLATTSDVAVVMNPIYEALMEVSRVAVTKSDETTAIKVSEAYQAIAIHTAHLGAPAFNKGTAPLTYCPVYYALECVRYAQSKKLDEVVFQSASILSGVSEVAPKDVEETDIHFPIIDGLTAIAAYFYEKRLEGLAEAVNGKHFSILAYLLQREDNRFGDVLRYVLEKVETLAPLAIRSESLAGHPSLVLPLGKVYGLVSPNSLAHLFEKAAITLPKVDPGRAWLNPYHDLIDIAGIIADHLYKIAENNEFGGSYLLRDIDQSIKYISNVIVKITDRPLRQGHSDENELINIFIKILAFYWVAFHGKRTVSGPLADECCASLMFAGLQFLEKGHDKVLDACISNMRSIVESYCKVAQPAVPDKIGDLLAHLWGIRLVLIAKHNVALIQKVDQALMTKPPGLEDNLWRAAQSSLVLRQQQLDERLAQRDDHRESRDDAELLLFRLLRGAPPQAD